jgi:thymidylate synthase ThyX
LRQRCWLYVIGQSYAEYIAERKEGIPAEEAASVLPGATKTEIVTTMNLRSWRNVFHERALNPRAQQQIRSLTQQVLDRFIEKLPWCFDDLRG